MRLRATVSKDGQAPKVPPSFETHAVAKGDCMLLMRTKSFSGSLDEAGIDSRKTHKLSG